MKAKYFLYFISLFVIVPSCKNEPLHPIYLYDDTTSKITIIQKDINVHDTVFIEVDNVPRDMIIVKDTIYLSVQNYVKSGDQYRIAYHLAKYDNQIDISLHSKRGHDTIFKYHFKQEDIIPIRVAKVLSGQCAALYDTNFSMDYLKSIKKWLFKNQISPDGDIIDSMNIILRSLNNSKKNEYSSASENIPIVSSLSNLKFKFDIDLTGKYFYLYSFPCKSGTPIRSFVEKKIAIDFKDAYLSAKDVFSCANRGGLGPNVLFLIAINENWKYELMPVGLIIIDTKAPSIYRSSTTYFDLMLYNMNSKDNDSWPKATIIKNQNLIVNIPNIPSIESSVSISTGHFQGDDYFGYTIPFNISITGDVKSITIGKHKLSAKSVYPHGCVKLKFRNLNIGRNYIPITATDSRGNTSSENYLISLQYIRNNNSYDENDYDDLEGRISDLEDKINDLE